MAGVSKVISCLRQTVAADGLDGTPDQQLLEQFIRCRDDVAFAVLVRRHGAMVWGVCRRLLFDLQDAEDAFQATFLVLVRKAASIRHGELLASWLFGVARRAALNARALRARRAQHELVGRDMPDVQAAGATIPEDSTGVLDEELAKLPEKYRLPLLLCGLEGMSHAEAGRKLGWPTGTVAGRVSRGRTLLRARLQRRGIVLSVAALAGLFAKDAAWAAAPRTLITATVQSATLAPGAVSANVAAVVHGVLKKMFLTRLLAGMTLLALATIMLGGAFWHVAWPDDTAASPQRIAAVPRAATKAPVPAEVRRKPSLQLPNDPGAVVIRLERFLEPSAGPRTVTTIYANGRMTVEVPESLRSLSPMALTKYANERAAEVDDDAEPETTRLFEKRLTPIELEDLLRFALHDQEFFEFDPAAVKSALSREYRSDGTVHDPHDDTITRLRVQTAAKEHEVQWTRLTRSAHKFADVKSLAKVYAVDMKLRHLFAVELAGGPDRVAAVVQRTNELAEPFYQLNPEAPRLTAQDLAGVTPLADGSGTRFTFGREKSVARVFFGISVDVPQEGDWKISFIIPCQ